MHPIGIEESLGKEAKREELGLHMSKQERRAEQLLKRVTREVQRMKKNSPNAVSASFREKMAFFTTVSMNVPIIPTESVADDSRMEELLQDGRVGHEV